MTMGKGIESESSIIMVILRGATRGRGDSFIDDGDDDSDGDSDSDGDGDGDGDVDGESEIDSGNVEDGAVYGRCM
jgi:hypothetical protein